MNNIPIIIAKRKVDLKLDRKEYEAFKTICAQRNTTTSKVIDTMIRKFNRVHMTEVMYGKESEIETETGPDLSICGQDEATLQGDSDAPKTII